MIYLSLWRCIDHILSPSLRSGEPSDQQLFDLGIQPDHPSYDAEA
jgi:hypothetical protein